jgi:Fe-S-cluster-containing dehydrogenase component
MPFKVVFCIGVGCCIKASMYGVTQLDAPDSIMAFFAIRMAILSSLLFCKFDRF